MTRDDRVQPIPSLPGQLKVYVVCWFKFVCFLLARLQSIRVSIYISTYLRGLLYKVGPDFKNWPGVHFGNTCLEVRELRIAEDVVHEFVVEVWHT